MWHLDKRSQVLVFKAKKNLQNIADLFSAQKRRYYNFNVRIRTVGSAQHENESELTAEAARVEVGILADTMLRKCTKTDRIFRSDRTKLHRIFYGERASTRTRSSRIEGNCCTKLHRDKLKIIDKDICLTETPAKAEAGKSCENWAIGLPLVGVIRLCVLIWIQAEDGRYKELVDNQSAIAKGAFIPSANLKYKTQRAFILMDVANGWRMRRSGSSSGRSCWELCRNYRLRMPLLPCSIY